MAVTVNVQNSAANVAAPRGRASARGAAPQARRRPATSMPVRADLPGALDHSSAEATSLTPRSFAGAGVCRRIRRRGGRPKAPRFDASRRDDLRTMPGGGGPGAEAVAVAPARRRAPPSTTGNRAIGFLRASWAELQRVQWPDRRQVGQATAVVLGFVVVAGAYLGLGRPRGQRNRRTDPLGLPRGNRLEEEKCFAGT